MDRRIDRRNFLRLVGATMSSPALADCPDATTPSGAAPWRMRLSTSTIHFKELPVEEAIARIAGLGYEAVDIWSAHDGCPHLDNVAERLGSAGLNALLLRNRLRLFSFSVYRGGYARYAELLGEAGGGVAVRGSAGPCLPAELQTRMRQFIRDLRPLIDLAERYDSFLAIENHSNALLDSLDSIRAFVEINTSPRLGIALAPYHLQARNASVPEAIRICGKQLFFFYAWQRGPGIEQLPGIGATDMVPWIRALADIEYTGDVNPFMHGHPGVDVLTANLARARAHMEDCYASAIKPG